MPYYLTCSSSTPLVDNKDGAAEHQQGSRLNVTLMVVVWLTPLAPQDLRHQDLEKSQGFV